MANTEVGSAYVTIYPQTDGNFSKMVGKELDSGSSGLSAKAVAIGNLMSSAITGVVTKGVEAIGQAVSDTFWNYADYEQLVGGVETLFKDAGSTVMDNAKQAFATAGLSANEYMENVTSFSASLISSLDGDTVKAAEIADKAMVDMSDNANKMGTDMEAITNAYQGFSKQNYTMLDNLKLGYGGTKQEMERLLADASKIAGVEFNIDSYADVIEAIHVMQESMGITGTTMEEGATTISGSINMLEGAWANFLTALGDGGQTMDLSQVTSDLIASLGAVADNVLPAIGRIASSVVTQLPGIVANALSGVPEQIKGVVSEVFGSEFGDTFGDFMTNMAATFDLSGLFAKFEEIGAKLQPVLGTIRETVGGVLTNVLPAIEALGSGFMDAVNAIVDVASNYLVPAIAAAAEFIGPVIEGVSAVWREMQVVVSEVVSAISSVVGDVFKAIGELVNEVMTAIFGETQDTWPNIGETVKAVMASIKATVGPVWQGIKETVGAVFGTIKSAASAVWPVIKGVVVGTVTAIKSAIDGIGSVVSGVKATFNGIKDAITHPIETAKGIIDGAINAIKGIINGAHLELPHFKLPHFNIDGGEVPWGIGGKGKPPSIGIEWYAHGGIVDGATLIGAGEKGPEAIVPLSGSYMRPFAAAVADEMGGSGDTYIINGITLDSRSGAQKAFEQAFRELRIAERA